MFKYQCKCCKATKDLEKATLQIKDDKVVTKEALCKCGKYMIEQEKKFDGFPSLIRTEPTLKK